MRRTKRALHLGCLGETPRQSSNPEGHAHRYGGRRRVDRSGDVDVSAGAARRAHLCAVHRHPVSAVGRAHDLPKPRRLSPTKDGIPVALTPVIDLERHQLRPLPVTGSQPTLGRIAFLSALALNVPLLPQLNGLQRHDVMWLAMPVLGAAVTYVLTTGVGPSLARILALRALERRTGQHFTTARLDELSAMRRTLWLARWLCREEDLHTPSPSGTGQKGVRQRC